MTLGGSHSRGHRRQFDKYLRRFTKHRIGAVGFAIVGLVAIVPLIGPIIAPFEARDTNLRNSLQAPSGNHYFGTDELGRDIFSEILWGTRSTLLITVLTVVGSVLIGVVIGAIAGYSGGFIDTGLSRMIDGFLVVPQELLAIVVVSMLGNSRINIVIALTIVFWPATARLVRGEYLRLRERPFVEAAKMSSLGPSRIIFGEILPFVFPLIVVNATFRASEVILAEAGLSFLGLNDPNVSSWGKMIFDSLNELRHGWWTAVFPGMAIVLLVLGLNLAGDSVNEILNPRTSRLGR